MSSIVARARDTNSESPQTHRPNVNAVTTPARESDELELHRNPPVRRNAIERASELQKLFREAPPKMVGQRNWQRLVGNSAAEVTKRAGSVASKLIFGHLVSVLVGVNPVLTTLAPTILDNVSDLGATLRRIWANSVTFSLEAGPSVLDRIGDAATADLHTYPPSVQAAIKEWNRKMLAAGNNLSEVGKLFVECETVIKGIPTRGINISHQEEGGDPHQLRQLNGSIEKLIASYPPSIRPQLSAFIDQARANSYLDEPVRAQIYCYGEPGTGKTRFAKLLATTLGVPFIPVAVTPKTVEALSTGEFLSKGELSDPNAWATLLGLVPAALLKAGVVNPVIFFDEVGDLLSGWKAEGFKTLLDPNTRALPAPLLGGAEFDFSQAIVVLAGNAPIRDAAIKSRLPEIHFGKLDLGVKHLNAHDYADHKLETLGKLAAAYQAQIKDAVKAHIPYIVMADDARQIAGMRCIEQVCDKLIAHVREQVLSGKDPSEALIRKFIDACFATLTIGAAA